MPLINNKEPRVRWLGDQHMLTPGVNEVSAKVWDAFKGLPVIQWLIAEGLLVEQEVESLAKLGVDAAVALIKETLNLDLLSKWKLDEKRAKVARAIETRMDEVKAAAESATKKDG